jgi:7-carboxy-7-deazaguanine synthase
MDLDSEYLLFAGENNTPEIFYTIEGEGEYVGQPSVFMRFFGCNLTCKAFASPDSPYGCDSYISWSKKNKLTFNETFKLLEDSGYIEFLKKGAILKYTGGESFLRQDQLLKFTAAFVDKYKFIPRIDFETNGTVVPDSRWVDEFYATFTVSPKLANNGDPESKRYNEEALTFFVKQALVNSAGLKFVIQNKDDIKEVFEKYINKINAPFTIPLDRVWFMPCCGSRQEHVERAPQVVEWCKEYGVNFSPRLHLLVFDKALRV